MQRRRDGFNTRDTFLSAEVQLCYFLIFIKFSKHNTSTPRHVSLYPGKPRPRVVWYRDDRPLSTPSWTGTDPGSGLEVSTPLFSSYPNKHPIMSEMWYSPLILNIVLFSGGQQQPNDGPGEERFADPAHLRDLQLWRHRPQDQRRDWPQMWVFVLGHSRFKLAIEHFSFLFWQPLDNYR